MANKRPAPSAAAILGKAQNTVINGGQFTAVNTVNHIKKSKANYSAGFKLLQAQVATAAFHNSAQRIDPPRCHENTRQAVLQEIFNWITQDKMRATWIAWLNGAAGAGKSAICQSIAEIGIAHFILVASFFFFRTDPSRSTIDPLVATIAYQLILLIPDAKDLICGTIERNPLIFTQSFEAQLSELIIRPLCHLRLTRATLKLFLIIDGVDECTGHENQTNIVRTLARFVAMDNSPIIVLFGSRSENQLQAVFRSRAVSGTLLQFPLDNKYLPDDDIRYFLTDKFTEIKETHPFSHLLSAQWPAPERVEEIVAKSSGQFIYASVIINFISLPHAYPSTQLDIIRGLRPSGLATPFSQLDALYRHIFSKVRDLQTTTTFLAFIILGKEPDRDTIACFFNLPGEDVISAFSDLASVVAWKPLRREALALNFLHASLPDFLFDRVRSQEYYIDTPIWSTRFALMSFQALQDPQAQNRVFFSTILHCIKTAEGTPDLQASMMKFNLDMVPEFREVTFETISEYLMSVKNMEFGDGGKVYLHHLNMIARFCAEHKPLMLDLLTTQHDISHLEIRAEAELEQMKKSKEAKVSTKVLKWVKRWLEKLFK